MTLVAVTSHSNLSAACTPAGAAWSAWFLRGVSYRVPVHMEYVGWRDSLDTIENGWLHGNLGSLSGETISPAMSHSETRSNQG